MKVLLLFALVISVTYAQSAENSTITCIEKCSFNYCTATTRDCAIQKCDDSCGNTINCTIAVLNNATKSWTYSNCSQQIDAPASNQIANETEKITTIGDYLNSTNSTVQDYLQNAVDSYLPSNLSEVDTLKNLTDDSIKQLLDAANIGQYTDIPQNMTISDGVQAGIQSATQNLFNSSNIAGALDGYLQDKDLSGFVNGTLTSSQTIINTIFGNSTEGQGFANAISNVGALLSGASDSGELSQKVSNTVSDQVTPLLQNALGQIAQSIASMNPTTGQTVPNTQVQSVISGLLGAFSGGLKNSGINRKAARP